MIVTALLEFIFKAAVIGLMVGLALAAVAFAIYMLVA